MVSFAAPLTFVSLIAGALADRIPRRHLVILSQAGNAALTLLLAGLDMMGVVQLWHLIILGLCNGSLMALNMPSRQAMISQVVPEGKLRNAISLGTAAMNVTAMAGPAAAGFLILLVDTHGTFFVIAGFYAFSAASVAMVNAGRTAMARSDKSIVGDIKEGLAYALGNRTLRGLIMVVFLAVIFGSAYWPLLAVWAREVLDVGADGLGILNSAMGVGALAGSLLLASMTGFKRSGLLLLLVCVGWGITLAVFAKTVSFAQALPTLVLVGLLSAIFMSLRSTLLQTHSSAEMRGRVVSIGMMSWGLMPPRSRPIWSDSGRLRHRLRSHAQRHPPGRVHSHILGPLSQLPQGGVGQCWKAGPYTSRSKRTKTANICRCWSTKRIDGRCQFRRWLSRSRGGRAGCAE